MQEGGRTQGKVPTCIGAGQAGHSVHGWVVVEMLSATAGDRTGAELLDQSRNQVATTVSARVGQWVTTATTGSSARRGVYDSEASSNSWQLLQILVLAP